MGLPDRLGHLALMTGIKVRAKSTYVYMIRCHDLVKIGIAVDVNGRLMELQVGNPYELELLGCWRSEDAIRDEDLIHSHLDKYRVRGEWFKLPKEIMDRITMKVSGEELARWVMPKEISVEKPKRNKLHASKYYRGLTAN